MHAQRDPFRGSVVCDAREQDGELVASEASRDVGIADRTAEPVSDLPEDLVTGSMAEGVVHRLELVEVDHDHGRQRLAVSDAADPSPVTRIVSVASNEPVNGPGDGSTAPDWVLTGALTLDLRAERSAQGSGRVYTITVESRDRFGNASLRTAAVEVPRN